MNKQTYDTLINNIERLCTNKDEDIRNEDFLILLFEMNGKQTYNNQKLEGYKSYQTNVISTLYNPSCSSITVWSVYNDNLEFEDMDYIINIYDESDTLIKQFVIYALQ